MIEREEAIEGGVDTRPLEEELKRLMDDGKVVVPPPEVLKQYRDEFERAGRADAPRPWAGMLGLWWELLLALAVVIGATPEDLRGPREAREVHDLHLRAWRWMWTLPPCSEARKAAFTLGHAAMMIDRWRAHLAACADDFKRVEISKSIDSTIGQRAEALLRILRWHIDDARGEASAKRDDPRTLPTWERLYERDQDGRFLVGHGWTPLAGVTGWSGAEGMEETARAILDDHVEHRREDRARLARIISRTGRTDLIDAFAKTAILSLPEGPWTMTSADVVRFAEMLLDDAEPAKAVSP